MHNPKAVDEVEALRRGIFHGKKWRAESKHIKTSTNGGASRKICFWGLKTAL